MSKTSGVDDQILSLPKGGGAVQSLATTFETDLNTGTGGFEIPINVPAGPNGIQPRLSIRYHTAAGNGPFGIGWTLGILTIARKIEGRIPSYTSDDPFTIVGAEELVEVAPGQYRPAVDTLQWRILRQGDGWEVTDTRGLRQRLGRTAQARIETVRDGAPVAAQWMLEDLTDTNGNSVSYTYLADGPQKYLDRIEWGTYSLRFFYESRPDPLTSARFGFLLPTTLRCSRIELHVTNIAPTLTRSWLIEYRQADGSGLSLLRRVTFRSHAADGTTQSAPPVTMDYTAQKAPQLERFEDALPGLTPGFFDDGRLELLDWNGDGLPDLLELRNGQARVWPNLGRSRWGFPQTQPQVAAPLNLDEAGVAFADMQGNGTADLLVMDRRLGGYYPLKPGGGFDRPVYWRQAPATPLSSGRARLVDLDANGIVDMLVTGDEFLSLYLREGVDGWKNEPILVPRSAAPPVNFLDFHCRIGDMNGDGLQDLVRVDGGGVTYWPYLGNAHWGEAVHMANAPQLPRNFDPLRLNLVDIDGDGCADLVYVDFDRILYWYNQGAARLSDVHEIRYTPPAGKPMQFRLADMKGNGTPGVLWSSVNQGNRRAGYAYLDLMGGSKPYLLTSIDNGLGLVTEIKYRPSTEFALDDAEAGNPWRTFHPFPLQCVSEMVLRDSITGLVTTTQHHYHEGRYDPAARTFLGFRVVEADNLGDAAIPTLRMRNTYHIGLDPDNLERPLSGDEQQRFGALRRRLLRTEMFGLDGSPNEENPYTVVSHEYATREEPSIGTKPIIVPFESRTIEEQYERAAAPFSIREIDYLDIDTHGNVTKQRTRITRSGAPQPDQDVTTEFKFAINLTTNIVSLPARVTQSEANGKFIAVTVSLYDGAPHQGLPEGQVDKGNLTLQQTLAIPDELSTAVFGANAPDWAALGYRRRAGETGWWINQTSYERQDDGVSLTLINRGPRGFDTKTEFDATRQFTTRVTDALNHVYRATVEQRAFQIASATDPNGNTTTDLFDILGRVTGTMVPGDPAGMPNTVFAYRTDILPARYAVLSREVQGQSATLDQYEYFDGRGQSILQIVEGEGDAGRNFIVKNAPEYTSRGQVSAVCVPYYVDTPDYAPAPPGQQKSRFFFDALGRVTREVKVNGAEVDHIYSPGKIEIVDRSDPADVRTLTHVRDGLSRVLAVERLLDGRIIRATYEYDAANRIARVQTPDGGSAQLIYDLKGRLLFEKCTDTGSSFTVPDAAGNQVSHTNGAGKTSTNKLDALDRVIEVREAGAAIPEIAYTYVNPGGPLPPDGLRNRFGRIWKIQDRLGTITSAYDERGRVLETRRTVDALGGRELITSVALDALGRQTQVTLPAPMPGGPRAVVDYLYNARGMPVSSPGFVRSAGYDVRGRMTAQVFQNGLRNVLDFDALTGSPKRLQVLASAGTPVRDQTFQFDVHGDLLNIASPLAVEAGAFEYDQLERLTKAAYGSGEQYAYAYSDGGNVTQVKELGSLTYGAGSAAVLTAGPNNYSHNAAGQMQQAPFGSLQYDALGHVSRIDVAGGAAIECDYDFNGLRAVKRVAGAVKSITADYNIEFHDGQAVVWISFAGNRVFASIDGGGVFLHADILGTPTLFTALDGGVVRRIAFSPYGSVRQDSAVGAGLPNGIRFTGQEGDPETGLVCLGQRYYDPRLGRFISPDVLAPGVYQVDSWNRYCYGHNNPLRYTDPSGLLSVGDVLAIIGIAIVVAALVVAGIFTGGATWAVAGVVINVSGLLFATAIGVAGGAIIGGIAAYEAGGDIWKGVLFGGIVGGVTAFIGGVLSAGALSYPLLGSKFLASIAAGALQGAVVGAGTGAAIGFAGGKGSAESFWKSVAMGALSGFITGALFGAVSGYLSNNPNTVLRVGTLQKFDPTLPASGNGIATYIDNAENVGADIGRWTMGPNSGGIGEFIALGEGPQEWSVLSQGALLNIPLGGVPNVLLNYGGIVAITNVSLGADKFGLVSYDDQLLFIFSLIPIVGVAFKIGEATKMGWYTDLEKGLHSGLSLETIS